MEKYQSVNSKSPAQAADIAIAGGVAGALSEGQKAQLEAVAKSLSGNKHALYIAIFPFAASYIVAEAIMYAIEKLNPKNWLIFKAKKED